MGRSLGWVVASFLCSSVCLHAQGVCPEQPSVLDVGGGTPGTNGTPQLRANGLPAINFGFSLRVTGGLPGASGLVYLGSGDAPIRGPGKLALIPGPGLESQSFQLDASGKSPSLLSAGLSPSLCGQRLFAQAFVVDPGGAHGLAYTNALAIRVGGRDLSGPPPGSLVPDAPALLFHETLTQSETVTIQGFAPGAALVEIEGPFGLRFVSAQSVSGPRSAGVRGGQPFTSSQGGHFSADLPLSDNQVNALTFTAVSEAGARSAPTRTAITRDNQPPALFIDFPVSGSTFTTPDVSVAGRVSDMLSGFAQDEMGQIGLRVSVDFVPALVDAGIGTNGTFFRSGVALEAAAAKTIMVTATDILGNSTTKSVVVHQADATGAQMELAGGDSQQGPVLSPLGMPLSVHVKRSNGTDFENKTVTFRVIRSDGRLSATQGGEGSTEIQTRTDSLGLATAWLRLGSDAGCGNNRVEVTSTNIAGSVFFCASAGAGAGTLLTIGSGNNQLAEAGGPLSQPLVAFLADGQNPVPGVPITFDIVAGGGSLAGSTSAVVTTDMTGHADVSWVLGPDVGLQVVKAEFPGMVGIPLKFVAEALDRDESSPTSLSGIVQDNARRPIGGATCELLVAGAELATMTDEEGCFSFPDAYIGGDAHLHVDGATATMLDGVPIPAGSFPSLGYRLSLIPNAKNPLATPVLLPPLNPGNAKPYSLTQATVLTVAGVPGIEFTIAPGSMRIHGQAAPAGTTVSLNQVHFDEIPMPMPDGAAPPFAWTLQPSGASFDPPIALRMPNMAGLSPGAVCYFLSFDHATERFEIVASGHVTEDGQAMVSDPGSGISVAGWGGFCPPYPNWSWWWWKSDKPFPPWPWPPLPPQVPPPHVPCVPFPEDNYFTCLVKILIYLGRSVIDSVGQVCLQFIDPDSVYYDPVNGFTNYRDCVARLKGCVNTTIDFALLKPSTVVGTPSSSDQEAARALGEVMAERIVAVLNAQPIGDNVDVSVLSASQIDVTEDLPAVIHDLDLEVSYLTSPSVLLGVGDGNILGGLQDFGFSVPSFAFLCVESTFLGGANVRLVVFELARLPRVTGSVNGRSVPVLFFEDIQVSNVPSPAGTPLRPVLVIEGAGIQYVSAPATYREGVIGGITDLVAVPRFPAPVFPESISLELSETVVTGLIPVTATVTGTMDDGTARDLSLFGNGTSYRSSNPAIATVDLDGMILPQSRGTATITASNEGATSTAPLIVSLGDPLTTVEGFVEFPDGTPVADAEVCISIVGACETTDSTGFFSFTSIPTDFGPLNLSARVDVGPDTFLGAKTGLAPEPGGTTDAGIIVVSDAVRWITVGPGDWSMGSNWSTGTVPTVSDDVVIDVPGGPFTVTVQAGAFAAKTVLCDEHLVIQSGGELSVGELLDVSGAITIGSGGLLVDTALEIPLAATLSGGVLRNVNVAAGEAGSRLVVTSNSSLRGCRKNPDTLSSFPWSRPNEVQS